MHITIQEYTILLLGWVLLVPGNGQLEVIGFSCFGFPENKCYWETRQNTDTRPGIFPVSGDAKHVREKDWMVLLHHSARSVRADQAVSHCTYKTEPQPEDGASPSLVDLTLST